MTLGILDIESRTTFTSSNGKIAYNCYMLWTNEVYRVTCSKHLHCDMLVNLSLDKETASIDTILCAASNIERYEDVMLKHARIHKPKYCNGYVDRQLDIQRDVIYKEAFTIDPIGCVIKDDAFSYHNGLLGIHISDTSDIDWLTREKKIPYKSFYHKGKYYPLFPEDIQKSKSLDEGCVRRVNTVWIDINGVVHCIEMGHYIFIKKNIYYDKKICSSTSSTIESLSMYTSNNDNVYVDKMSKDFVVDVVEKLMMLYSKAMFHRMASTMGYVIGKKDKSLEIINETGPMLESDIPFITSPIRTLYGYIVHYIITNNVSKSQAITMLETVNDNRVAFQRATYSLITVNMINSFGVTEQKRINMKVYKKHDSYLVLEDSKFKHMIVYYSSMRKAVDGVNVECDEADFTEDEYVRCTFYRSHKEKNPLRSLKCNIRD